jgi:trans-aconitate methyltransferase
MAEMFANAAAYERVMGRWSARLAPPVADFSQVRDIGRVLDVGCGTGVLVQFISDTTRRSSIVGIDQDRVQMLPDVPALAEALPGFNVNRAAG